MRTSTVIFLLSYLLFLGYSSNGQSREKYLFQVLDAKNAFTKSGALERFAYVHRNSTINIKDGYLYLVHYSGLSIEFTEDTTIYVSNMINRLGEVKSFNVVRDLRKLFNEESIVKPMHHFNPIFTHPPLGGPHNIQVDLCLAWKNLSSNEFKISLMNMFSDTIKIFRGKGNQVTIPAEVLKHPDLSDKYLEIDLGGISNTSIWFKLFDSDIKISPYSCSANSTETLLKGYWLETVGMRKEAEEYYRVAASLSKHSVFQEALDFYLKRKAKYKK